MSEARPLARTRCFHHGTREAVGRCTSCERSFCRECLVEHDGRLTCAPCLERAAEARPSTRDRRGRAVRAAATIAGALLLWSLFFLLGLVLLSLPDSFHTPVLPS